MDKDKHIYMPVLKWKQGEYLALEKMEESDKVSLLPLVDISPVAWDFDKECPKKSIKAHIDSLTKNFNKKWGANGNILIDFRHIDVGIEESNGFEPIEYGFEIFRRNSVQAIPVTDLDREDIYQKSINAINKTDKKGCAIRLYRKDLYFSSLPEMIDKLLSRLDLYFDEIDLILDLKTVGVDDLSSASIKNLIQGISSIPAITNWRSFTLLSSGFPEDLPGIVKSSCEVILPRYEVQIWKSLKTNSFLLERLPIYGDYGVEGTVTLDDSVDLSKVDARVNIRYTLENDWLVIKKKQARKHGHEQFQTLCKDLVARSEYYGREFSWGDEEIFLCARNETGNGNHSTWRKIGVSHHVAVVLDELTIA